MMLVQYTAGTIIRHSILYTVEPTVLQGSDIPSLYIIPLLLGPYVLSYVEALLQVGLVRGSTLGPYSSR